MRRTWKRLLALALCGFLAACGGADDEDKGAEVAERSGEATITSAGGSVDAVLAGGTTLRIDIPANALSSPTTLRLEPVAAQAGSLGGFRVTPADLPLSKPARLTLSWAEGGTPPLHLVVAFLRGEQMLPISPAMRGTRLSFELDYLGLRPDPMRLAAAHRPGGVAPHALAEPGRKQILATAEGAPSETLHLLTLTPQQRLDQFRQMVTILRTVNGSLDLAMDVQRVFEAVLYDPEIDKASSHLRQTATDFDAFMCAQHAFALSAIDTYAGSAAAVFQSRASAVLGWGQVSGDFAITAADVQPAMNSSCMPRGSDFRQPVVDRLPDFKARVEEATLHSSFNQLMTDDVRPLLTLEAGLRLFDLDDLMLDLLNRLTNRLRAMANDACRDGLGQVEHQTLLHAVVTLAGFAPMTTYDAATLREDIQRCGMRMRVKPIDLDGATMATLQNVGSSASPTELDMDGVHTLRFEAQNLRLRALQCPAGGSGHAEQLVFEAGPSSLELTELSRLTPAAGRYLDSPAHLLLEAARLFELRDSVTKVTTLRVRRVGGLCNADFEGLVAHSVLVELKLGFDKLKVKTLALPAAVAHTAYSTTVAAEGGATPYSWSASGLPAGLTIHSGSGVISGTATAHSSSTVELEVTDSAGVRARKSLTLEVRDNLEGTWVGTITASYSKNLAGNYETPRAPGTTSEFHTGPNTYTTLTNVSASGSWQVKVDVVAGHAVALQVLSSTGDYVLSFNESRKDEFKHRDYGPHPCITTIDTAYGETGATMSGFMGGGGSLRVGADGSLELSFGATYRGIASGSFKSTTTLVPGRQECRASSTPESGSSSEDFAETVSFTAGIDRLLGSVSAGSITGSGSFSRSLTGGAGEGSEMRTITLTLRRP